MVGWFIQRWVVLELWFGTIPLFCYPVCFLLGFWQPRTHLDKSGFRALLLWRQGGGPAALEARVVALLLWRQGGRLRCYC